MSGAVFISYASQDAAAALRLAEALRASGVEVWFDQNELVGGDAWDAKIRGQIAGCTLFVPVISAATQARLEGYFRLEWKLAAQRTHTMADERVFLLPVVIDETKDAEAKVPAEFKAVQWTRLPGGETSAAFCARLQKLLERDGLVAGASRETPAAVAVPASTKKWNWLGYGWAAVGLAFALIYAVRPFWSERGATRGAAVAQTRKAEASRPLDRALQLRALNGLSRDRLAAAEDLLAPALKADPTNAAALALAAQVDALMVFRSWDLSEDRRQSATARSARALALAPDDFESRRAQAIVAGFMVRTPASLQEAETLYRTLAAERAGDPQVLEELGTVLQSRRKFDEAAQVFTQASRPELTGVALYWAGRMTEARRIADDLLAQRRSAAALILKANVELFGYNNRAAAQAAVDQLTPTELREDDAAGIALRLAVLRRDAEGLLRLLEPFPHPFVSILGVNYPRQYWTGLARSWQNQPEAAEIEWRGGLRSLEERLAAKPSDADALSWIAMFHACLGQRAEMNRSLRTYGNYRDLSAGRWDFNYCLPLLRFGERKDEVIDRLARTLRETPNFNRILYAWARYSPEFDPIRGDSRFESLLRETRPQTAVPFDDGVGAASAPAADEKSVAVLAFANLSEDKGNEYFSDGISEELLNVLAKVPGLKVSARTSAFYFKGKDVPVAEIARQLGVAYVVEGSVRKAGDKVRIAAQLVKAADGFQVWSDTFTRELKDVFAVQDEIAGIVAKKLELTLAGSASTSEAPTPEALEIYMQAREAWNRRNPAGYDRAEELLQRVLQLSPRFAKAHSALADVWELRGEWFRTVGRFGQRQSPAVRKIRAKIEEALAIDPDCAEALASAGLSAWDTWSFAEGERSLRRAIALNPNYASAHQWLGRILLLQGRLGEAVAETARAAALDPLSSRVLDNHGWALLDARRYAEALEVLDRALEIRPDNYQARALKARACIALGRREEAMALVRSIPAEVKVGNVFSAAVAGLVGDEKLVERYATELDGPGVTACAGYAALGKDEEAARRFELDAVDATSVDFIYFDPVAARLRQQPAFREKLAALGLGEALARAMAETKETSPARE